MANVTAQTPVALSSSSLTGTDVINAEGENLGNIKDIMIDTETGDIAYAVLSFGGVLGIGDKLFAIPWSLFTLDGVTETMVLNVDRETLKEAEGFDKDDWPLTNREYIVGLYEYYDAPVYW